MCSALKAHLQWMERGRQCDGHLHALSMVQVDEAVLVAEELSVKHMFKSSC